MRHAKFLIAIFSMAAILSCTKKEDKKVTTTDPPEKTCSLTDKKCLALNYETEYSVHSKIVYDEVGRIIESDDYIIRYEPGKMKAFRKLTNHYREAKLNSSGKIIAMYSGKYNMSDSSIVNLTLNDKITFDAEGKLLKYTLYSVSPVNYVLEDGSSKNFYHAYNRFEYDSKGNVTKYYRGVSDEVTELPAGELLWIEYLQYDEKLNPTSENEMLRFVTLLDAGDEFYSNNNPIKAKFYFKDYNPFGNYKYDPWEANYKNSYNEHCYITDCKFTQLTVSLQPIEQHYEHRYKCDE